jgi:phosphosulfolactate phosphohydrolase-like enzyme
VESLNQPEILIGAAVALTAAALLVLPTAAKSTWLVAAEVEIASGVDPWVHPEALLWGLAHDENQCAGAGLAP